MLQEQHDIYRKRLAYSVLMNLDNSCDDKDSGAFSFGVGISLCIHNIYSQRCELFLFIRRRAVQSQSRG